jgi:ankyrin repeat protein
LLIARGARLDNRTLVTLKTPLIEAAQMNRTEMVKFLLDHGADRGGRGFPDRGVSGFLPVQYSNRRAEIHEETKT